MKKRSPQKAGFFTDDRHRYAARRSRSATTSACLRRTILNGRRLATWPRQPPTGGTPTAATATARLQRQGLLRQRRLAVSGRRRRGRYQHEDHQAGLRLRAALRRHVEDGALSPKAARRSYTSWYSGFASYGVGAWPNTAFDRSRREGALDHAPIVWTFAGVTDGRHQPQQGRSQGRTTTAQAEVVHGDGRQPAPGHAHGPTAASGARAACIPGVVQHGWGDGRGVAISGYDRSGRVPAPDHAQRSRDGFAALTDGVESIRC